MIDDAPLPLSERPSILVISDRLETPPAGYAALDTSPPWEDAQFDGRSPRVIGSYLERLPLACVAAGLVERAEVWHHVMGDAEIVRRAPGMPVSRAVAITDPAAPFHVPAMIDLLRRHGAPHILLVLGLGVREELLLACRRSLRVYNSIDAPALRVPGHVSRHFDLVLTGARWQSDVVEARHPGMLTGIMPIGPEFASMAQFMPLDIPKDYDLIYVAAAQDYKRHDILFEALDACPRDVRALCLFGYGERADDLRAQASQRGLAVDFIGPPGLPYDDVNRLMNRAKMGVVCGRDDGAPAIITEYMLADLPVLANAELVCGTQYITPDTGLLATPAEFAQAILYLRSSAHTYRPRATVLDHWTWPHSIKRFAGLLDAARLKKSRT